MDGQQRLTSLYAVLMGKPVMSDDYTPERIYIAFRPRDAMFQVADAATRRDPELIPTLQLWVAHGSYEFITKFIGVLSGHREVTDAEKNKFADAITRLHGLTSYPFVALELSSTMSEEMVADVLRAD